MNVSKANMPEVRPSVDRVDRKEKRPESKAWRLLMPAVYAAATGAMVWLAWQERGYFAVGGEYLTPVLIWAAREMIKEVREWSRR